MTKKTNIADQILQELKVKSAEAYQRNKSLCIEFVRNQFDKKISSFEKIEVDKEYTYGTSFIPTGMTVVDMAQILKDCGFKVKYNLSKISFSIPQKGKDDEMTEAYKLLYDHNCAVDKLNAEYTELGNAEAKRIRSLIESRGFEWNDNKNGTYTISISLNENRGKQIGDEKILEFLSSNGFTNAIIKDNLLSIVLGDKSS